MIDPPAGCIVCGRWPVIVATGMCAPCTFGEADTLGEDFVESSDCPKCNGLGKVPTAQHESYYGAMYKPCPICHADPCIGEPPLSTGRGRNG